MHRIWIERPLPERYLPLLANAAEVVDHAGLKPENSLASRTDIDGIIAAGRLRYRAELFARNPGLKVVCRTGIGVDNVEIPAATRHGVAVCNVPDGPTVSTAEHAVTLMMAVAKGVKHNAQAVRAGGIVDFHGSWSGVELDGLTLGLVGFGRIGRRVARIAQAIGMQVRAYDPYLSPEAVSGTGVELVSCLDDILRESDVVSLHLPLTEQTRGLMNASRIGQMKTGAILINSARGGLVDEAALLTAVEEGKLFGAGVDVFQSEPPPPDHPLLHCDRVICTPHVASATAAGKHRVWESAIRQVLQVVQGERPAHLVNPEVWPAAFTGSR